MQQISGQFGGRADLTFGIVVARFNDMITRNLLEGALEALERHGTTRDRCTVVWVPGAFELPLAARRLWRRLRPDGLVCLGAVVRGATPHFDYVAGEAASGIARLAHEADVPIGFGVLTTDTIEQAIERSGVKAGNKGADAALTVLEMIDCLRRIDALGASS